jgi:5-methylcytosine-specific restriction protein A
MRAAGPVPTPNSRIHSSKLDPGNEEYMTKRTWDHGGKSAAQRGYGRQHQKLRALLLAQEPLCRPCRAKGKVTAATIADHIVPLAKGGAAHDLANLQPVCAGCHDAKTRADNGWRKAKPVIGIDGWPCE